MILAVQEQSFRTNAIKTNKIDKRQENSICWLCKKSEKTVRHIVGGCSRLAQKEYKRRHGRTASALESLQKIWCTC